MAANEFLHERRVYLCDTNAEGNSYFARYFEWQGTAREDFFRCAVPDHMAVLQSGIKLITVHAWLKYEHETTLFDEVLIKVRTTSLKKMSMELGFTYVQKDSGELIAVGGQKLAYADYEGNLIPVPQQIRTGAATCLVDQSTDVLHMELTKKRRTERELITVI